MSDLVVLNAPGQMQLFTCAYNGPESASVLFAWQDPGLPWAGWATLNCGFPIKAISAGLEQNGQTEVFAVDNAGTLRVFGTYLGSGYQIADIVVGQNQDGRLEIFARDVHNSPLHLYQTAANNGWSNWAFLGQGGYEIAQMTVALNQGGWLEVFGVDVHGSALHIWQDANGPNGGWSNWTFLGSGYTIAEMAVARNQDGRLEVFALDVHGTPLHIWQNTPGGTWSEWVFLGQGGIAFTVPSTVGGYGTIAAALNQQGWLEAFAVDTSGRSLYTRQGPNEPNSGWSNWTPLGGDDDPGSPPIAVTKNPSGLLEVFEISPATPYSVTQQASGSWSANWSPLLPSTPIPQPGSAADQPAMSRLTKPPAPA